MPGSPSPHSPLVGTLCPLLRLRPPCCSAALTGQIALLQDSAPLAPPGCPPKVLFLRFIPDSQYQKVIGDTDNLCFRKATLKSDDPALLSGLRPGIFAGFFSVG